MRPVSWIKFTFHGNSPSGLTKLWMVQRANGDTVLAWIAWYAPWRKYTMHTLEGVVFDQACLREIADFCENETRRHAGQGVPTQG